MRRIAPHLSLASTTLSNVWLHEDPAGRRFLIDTGHPVERLLLLANLWKAGIRMKGDLTAILLTHRHSDHAGNAAFIRGHFGARVYCHRDDADILTGKKGAPPAPEETGAFFKTLLNRVETRYPVATEVDEVYTEGGWKWGFRVIFTPGHTEGSAMLLHEPTSTLYSGDTILSGNPFGRSILRKSRKLRLSDPAFCVEPLTALRSARRFLSAVPAVETLCPGHGPVLEERVKVKLLKLGAELGV